MLTFETCTPETLLARCSESQHILRAASAGLAYVTPLDASEAEGAFTARTLKVSETSAALDVRLHARWVFGGMFLSVREWESVRRYVIEAEMNLAICGGDLNEASDVPRGSYASRAALR